MNAQTIDTADFALTRLRGLALALEHLPENAGPNCVEQAREILEVAAELAVNRMRDARGAIDRLMDAVDPDQDAMSLLQTEIALYLAIVGSMHAIEGEVYTGGPLRIERAEWFDLVAWLPAVIHDHIERLQGIVEHVGAAV